ncbi:hypothetical protein BASA81_000343 [Batrachochytrium salamandrivorans]|nr:hypothetical protein BASA81_000343 [Batrachochytrium salamandrivorans]
MSAEFMRRQPVMKPGDVLERWKNPPRIWRSVMCEATVQGRSCQYGHTCPYAHTKEHLRHLDDPFPMTVYVPRKGAGEEPPSLHQSVQAPPPPGTIQEQLHLVDPSVKHPMWNVPAEEIDPEQCTICYEDDKFADRRWKPCGHMVCSECMANWRIQSISKKVNGTKCHLCRTVVVTNETLPKAERFNAQGRQKSKRNVWADPETRAVVAQTIVGSQLSMEEERAMEANMRQRLRERQQQQAGEKEEFQRLMEDMARAEEDATLAAQLEEKKMMAAHEEEIKKLLNNSGGGSKPRLTTTMMVPPASTKTAEQSYLPPFNPQQHQEQQQQLMQASLHGQPQQYGGAFSPPLTTSPPPGFSLSPPLPSAESQRRQMETLLGGGQGGRRAPPPGFESTLPKPIAPALSPSAEDARMKSLTKQQAKLNIRKARENALSRSADASSALAAPVSAFAYDHRLTDSGGLSSWEYEFVTKRAEQEALDFALAKKLAEELENEYHPVHAPPSPHAAAPVVSVAKKNDNWQCTLCTFENEPLHPACAMCETPRGNSRS